jgi:hypothetical protein
MKSKVHGALLLAKREERGRGGRERGAVALALCNVCMIRSEVLLFLAQIDTLLADTEDPFD